MKKASIYAIVIAAFLWLASFLFFALSIYQNVSDGLTKTDAIVVLTGGANRISEALKLLQDDKADTLFISGVHKDTTLKAITPVNIPNKTIILGKAASNTLENAQETATFVIRNRFKSIRLVTSSYHMRRSILELRIFIPDVTIVPHPVFSDTFKHKDWWKWSGTFGLLITEHAKYNAAFVRHLIFSVLGLNYRELAFIEDTQP